ncbi:MFS transporter [Chromobacterium sp. IIBBL 290-4]|uniref:MFS transporter n=1 Tax=Chromobacterium sp. IIBBL 290-4 TaxID=2953890 RepID=UPI0020B8E3CA|nr:MFS transporter [Chromobacterium sp. IIBBL 290-4]UTH74604.1 MFS transporter [Chromobacterium sp. IIBBL 290-4]
MLLACLLVFVTQMATTVYLPSLPRVMAELVLSKAVVEASIAVFVIGAALAVPMWGDVAQRRGRRAALNCALSLFVACSLLLAFASSGASLLFLRAAQGIAAGGCAIVGRILARDFWSGDELVKRLSLLSIAFITAMGGGQFIGGLIAQYDDWRHGFLLLAACGVGIGLLSRGLPLQAGQASAGGMLASYRRLLRRPGFVLASCCGGAGFAAIVVLQQASPFLFQLHYRLSPAVYGAIGLLLGAAYFSGAMLVNRSVMRLGAARLLQAGALGVFAAAALLAGLWSADALALAGFIALYCALTFCQAVLFPNSMALAVEDGKGEGAHAMALCGFLLQTIGGVGALMAVILDDGYAWTIALAGLGLVCGALAWAWSARRA